MSNLITGTDLEPLMAMGTENYLGVNHKNCYSQEISLIFYA